MILGGRKGGFYDRKWRWVLGVIYPKGKEGPRNYDVQIGALVQEVAAQLFTKENFYDHSS